ncbi:MAG: hypothetical protein DHS20C14_12560 [Phycisphaeraceae bacterium]|nr:MAG: hypothetical protein DHS20C14_12560 [Phycisphaeraceae bacterium]
MPASNVCWGVEIGAGAIKAIKLELEGDQFNVLDFAIVNHSKVLSTPELDQEDATRVALGALTNQVDLSGAQIAISVPGHQSFARFAKLPPVEPKKVPDIVKFEAVQQIPFPLEDVEWDYQTFVSPDSPDVEVGIFAITRQRIMERLNMLTDVGLTPDVATISPVAAYNALAVDLEFTSDTAGTIILDVGTVATDLIIAEAGRVWVRTFPIGGHQFTEALVNAFKISYGKAEKLKREAEQTKHARHVFQAMRPVFGDLVQEVQRSIGFYRSVHPDTDLKRLVGLGSTFKLPGLRKYLKQQLQLDVYRMEQFKKLSVDGPRAGEFQAATLNLCTAYGLALQGLDHAALKANLMPVTVLREAMWKRKVPWFAASAGIAAAAAGAMFIRPLMDSSKFTAAEQPRVLTEVSRDARTLRSAAEEAGVTGSASPDLRASSIVGLLSDRGVYARILDDTGLILSSASQGAPGGGTPIAVASMNTTFVPSGKASASAPVDTYSDPRGGQDDWRTGGGGGMQAAAPGRPAPMGGMAADVAERLDGKRYVRVETVFETTLPERQARQHMKDTVEAWLQANEKREGVEYDIVISDQREPWMFAMGEAPGGRTTSAAGRGVRGTPVRGTAVGSGGSSGSGDVSRIAPLEKPTDETTIAGTFTVVWYALLDNETKGGES